VGFESSQVARRRLAAAAMRDRRVQEALLVGGGSAPASGTASEASAEPMAIDQLLQAPGWGANGDGAADGPSLALVLDDLAVDILDTPGAGGALLEAFAEQTRVLRLVVEALERAPDRPLPAPVAAAVRHAVAGAPRAVTVS